MCPVIADLRRPFAALLLAAVVAALPGAAHAATQKSVRKDAAAADVVFRGKVTSADKASGKPGHRMRAYVVQADRVYQGSTATTTVRVTTRAGTSKCALPKLSTGTSYIFFVVEKNSLLKTDRCRGTSAATAKLTRLVVKRLGNGKLPQTPIIANPTFTRVSGATPSSVKRLAAPGAAMLLVSLLGLLVVGGLGRRRA
ncbi:MAG: hypothetical protein ACR2K3_12135 [Nocardioides sp.]